MTCAKSGLQVWGVIIGIGNQSFAEHWELVGAGTRAWEVCPPRLEHFLGSHEHLQWHRPQKQLNVLVHSIEYGLQDF